MVVEREVVVEEEEEVVVREEVSEDPERPLFSLKYMGAGSDSAPCKICGRSP